MGYTTDFQGCFFLGRPMKKRHAKYLIAFSESRRMRRDSEIAVGKKDKLRKKVGLPIGVEGEFYVNSYFDGFYGQHADDSVLDSSSPPSTQPGLWCQWIVGDEDGNPINSFEKLEDTKITCICWNGVEKFYSYIDWLHYVINNFLIKWDYKLNGVINWRGEGFSDIGQIQIVDNTVFVKEDVKAT